jgi:predicted TIM-barrel fold metal-dependent hydrolase
MTNEGAGRAKIFDSHFHFGRHCNEWLHGEPPSDDVWFEAQYEARLAEMDEVGCERSLVLTSEHFPRVHGLADTARANELTMRLVERDPEKFVAAFGVVEPQHGRAGLDEIRRLHERGFLGVNWHPRFLGVWVDDPWLVRQVELVRELGMLPMIHCVAESNQESEVLLEKVARLHPEEPLVVLDAMHAHTAARECREIASRNANMWFEISIAWHPFEVKAFAAEVGHDRLLFGRPGWTVNSPEALASGRDGLSDEAVDDIVCHNLDRLLRRFGR